MSIFRNFIPASVLCCFFFPAIVWAEPILDKVEIIQTATEADIHIDFQTQIRYVRHFPQQEASRIQLFLEFPEYVSNGLPLPTAREFLNSPPTNLVPAFTVNFPDQGVSSVVIAFKEAVKFRVTPDSSGRGIIVHIPLQKGLESKSGEMLAPATPVAPVVEAPIEVPGVPAGMSLNEYVGKLVAESRVAMGLGEYPKAIELLNAALNQPLATSSEEAQELIGVAREKNGDYARAKSEDELYLKLYPNGEGAKRVNQHLVTVNELIKTSALAAPKKKKAARDVHETTVYGSWDQYFYDAHTHNYSPTGNSTTHDQHSLVSSINLTARTRQNEYDAKMVFRNRQTMDFLPTDSHKNRDRTDAAYLELANKDVDYMVRLGRQNGNSGGVMGRFDGAWLRYGFTPKYRVNVVGGSLVEYRVDYKRHFYGINLDIGPLAENWSGNMFFVNQEVDNITDRRAVGGELRYFAKGRSVYSLLDYDTLYKRVNIAMVQGNMQTEGGTNFNLLVDHRKSPVLTTVNSLSSPTLNSILGFTPTTLNQPLRAGLTESFLRSVAVDNTLDTDTALFGVTRQVTPRWQLGGDVQVSKTSGTPGASAAAVALYQKNALDNGIVLTQQEIDNFTRSVSSIGNIWTYHVQAVGTDTLFKDDTSIVSLTFSESKLSRSQSILFTNGFVPANKWRIDSSLQLLRQDSDPSTLSYIVSPTVRASYRVREKATIEAEIRFDIVNTHDDVAGHSRTFRDAAFIGYRIDI